MAKFTGYSCDSCGEMMDKDQVTTKVVRFGGPNVNGQYSQELCSNCVSVPDGVTLRPGPGRKPGTVAKKKAATKAPTKRVNNPPDDGASDGAADDAKLYPSDKRPAGVVAASDLPS